MSLFQRLIAVCAVFVSQFALAESLLAQTFFPAAAAKDVCPDTPLRITFSSPPIVGSGKIQVFDAANDSVVASIDAAERVQTKSIGGLPNYNYYPILVTDNLATITLPEALAYNKTYYVKLDAGAFKDFAGVSDANAWRFTTKSAPPEVKSSKLTVAADGSGDFATVQGAIDSLPEQNSSSTTILIKNGTYNEIICIFEKHNITLAGEDRKKTIIAYPNNDRFNNNAGGNPFAIGAGPPATQPRQGGAIYRRGLLLGHRCRDLTITNLTLHNTTPHGGSQAEAIILNGSATDAHAILRGVDLYSFQDTLQINGQAYIRDCYIEGDVDFLWGTGPCFFDACHITSVRSKAYYTQIRNPPTNHGFVFKDCTLDGTEGVTGNFLSRVDPGRFTHSEVVLINCTMTDAVGPAAWQLQRTTSAPNVHFWEYNSHTPDGKPVDTSQRRENSKQLKLPEDKETIDQYSDPRFVLGGWSPGK